VGRVGGRGESFWTPKFLAFLAKVGRLGAPMVDIYECD